MSKELWQMLAFYLAAVNLAGFFLMGIDKWKAKRGAWRISEKTLLLTTWLLGGVGAWLAMRVFRHKTQHTAFIVSAPIGAVISIAAMAFAAAKLMGVL